MNVGLKPFYIALALNDKGGAIAGANSGVGSLEHPATYGKAFDWAKNHLANNPGVSKVVIFATTEVVIRESPPIRSFPLEAHRGFEEEAEAQARREVA